MIDHTEDDDDVSSEEDQTTGHKESRSDDRPPGNKQNNFDPGPEDLILYERCSAYGRPDCPICNGTGRISGISPPGYRGPPSLRMCKCVLQKKLRENIERGMAGLSSAKRLMRSPLSDMTRKDVRITAGDDWMAANLKHIALRKPFDWSFKVVTDAELAQAWLATVAAQGYEIFDADVRRDATPRSLRYMTLDDLAGSAQLLIIRMGVKTAPNKEMPNLLLETIRIRQHEGLPTWVWDQHDNPLSMGHRCWSDLVDEYLCSWDKVSGVDSDLEEVVEPIKKKKKPLRLPSAPAFEALLEEEPPSQRYDASEALLDLGSKKGRITKRKNGSGFR